MTQPAPAPSRHRRASRILHAAAFCLLLLTPAWATPAWAQLSRVGNSMGLADVWVFGTDPCYDSVHQVYLVVGGQGQIWGVFSTTAGLPVGSQFLLGGSTSRPYGLFPRCAFSPDANGGQGAFLVTWHQDDSVNFVHSVMVSYPGGVIANSQQTLSDGAQSGSNFNFGAAVAYSAASQKFLVAWGTFGWNIHGRLVGLNGSPVGGIQTLVSAPSGGGVRDPALTWNPVTDEFGLAFGGFIDPPNPGAGGFVQFRLIRASDAALGTTSARFGQAAGTFSTDVEYNQTTNRYVVGWTGSGGRSAELDAQTNIVRTGLISTRIGTATSFCLAYNPISGTFLAVSEDPGGTNDDVGLELNGNGTANTDVMVLTNGGGTTGSYFPRVGARTDAKEWNISFARRFTSIADQIVATTSSQAAPISNIQMAIDSPGNGWVFRTTDTITLQGWAVDRAASSGTGIDTIHVWAFPSGGGGGIFLAGISAFTPRTDVGGVLGAQFTNSGYAASFSLPLGTYTINAYPHSTVSGNFGNPKSVSVTIAASLPVMSLDSPANGATVSNTFAAAGWALDRFAPADQGTGVVAVHVWAFPASGPPQFFGQATLGGSRTDVGAVFGAQFNNSGFNLLGTLPAGTYRLVAYMYDALTNSWALSQGANITVTGPVSSPLGAVDSPTAGSVALGANIGGWAIDRGSPSGTGVDAVHVWAFPIGGGAVFVGAATLGFARPDVGGIYGAQFTNSGYNLALSGLTSGQTYDLAVYARSTVSWNFNQLKVVRITVQ